jgi:2,4-dienoyl-CoA reductase-like NADH-dependent reductase (Old Yellow Enzyme family)
VVPAGRLQARGQGFLKSYPYEEAYFLPKARRFRDALDMPLILLGGISTLEAAETGLAEGFEFVAMGRALLHDPDLVNQFRDGHVDGPGASTATGACPRSTPAPGAPWSTPVPVTGPSTQPPPGRSGVVSL